MKYRYSHIGNNQRETHLFSDCKEEEDDSPFLHERRRRSVTSDSRQSAHVENGGRQMFDMPREREDTTESQLKLKVEELEKKIQRLGTMPWYLLNKAYLQGNFRKREDFLFIYVMLFNITGIIFLYQSGHAVLQWINQRQQGHNRPVPRGLQQQGHLKRSTVLESVRPQ